jgi:hypothetical protein
MFSYNFLFLFLLAVFVGLEGGPKYVMYLSLGIENHLWANFPLSLHY